jgi:hypothetical protein
MWIIISCVQLRFIGEIHVDHHFHCSPPVYWWDTCGSSFPVFTTVYWWDTCGSSFSVFIPSLLVGYMWIIISCVHPWFIGGIHVDHHFLCSPPVCWWDTCGSSFPVFTPRLLVGYMWIIISCVHPRFIGGIHVDHHFLCSLPVY